MSCLHPAGKQCLYDEGGGNWWANIVHWACSLCPFSSTHSLHWPSQPLQALPHPALCSIHTGHNMGQGQVAQGVVATGLCEGEWATRWSGGVRVRHLALAHQLPLPLRRMCWGSMLQAEGAECPETWFKVDLQTGELVPFPLLLVYIHEWHEAWYDTGVWVNGGEHLLVCCLSVIASLPGDLCQHAGDSHSQCHSGSNAWQPWERSGWCECWVIMCMQLAGGASSCCSTWQCPPFKAKAPWGSIKTWGFPFVLPTMMCNYHKELLAKFPLPSCPNEENYVTTKEFNKVSEYDLTHWVLHISDQLWSTPKPCCILWHVAYWTPQTAQHCTAPCICAPACAASLFVCLFVYLCSSASHVACLVCLFPLPDCFHCW